MKKSFNIKIGGQAGEGIKVAGLILARALTRLGFSLFGYSEYPSLIRGGHNTYQIQASIDQVFSQIKKIDFLIALNQETINLHQKELTKNSLILYDPGEFSLPQGKLIGQYLPIKFIELAKQAGGQPLMANMVALGAVLGLLGLPLTTLNQVIAKEFSDKPQEITLLNQKASATGKKAVSRKFSLTLPQKQGKKIILTGNEAVSLGAIAGGLKFYAAYPMTPATSILHYLAAKAKKADIFVKHTEDEISAINMAIGASFSGARSMVATSGGGLCLMAEAISLAGVSETPVVIVNAMRPGPALGMPTWTAQGDLKFVLNIGHDEFPRIVLAPGDGQEAFHLTKLALELAEKYQLPVFILTDKYLSESDFSLAPFTPTYQNQRWGITKKLNKESSKRFKRYQITKNGLSFRSLPGQAGGIYCANSYEHEETGLGTESGKMRNLMMDKRMKKLALITEEIPQPPIFGPRKAQVSLISWGSNKGPILEMLKTEKNINFLHLSWLWPFPLQPVKKFIQSAKKVICLEANATSQLASLIREQTGLAVESLLKYNGRPFYPEEILNSILAKN
jgi:2-oxoglutarate ferredoxin oxidoreductase subunit alpha